MAVTAAMVKELREMTGAGMMDCKKALAATDGDMDKAVEFLREKGLAGAEKKAGRIAAEGIVATAMTEDEKKAVVVEVNAETDFVAKNAKFQAYVAQVAAQATSRLLPGQPGRFPRCRLICHPRCQRMIMEYLGAQGLRGKHAAMEVHIESSARHTATIAVGVNVACYAHRRSVIRFKNDMSYEILSHKGVTL